MANQAEWLRKLQGFAPGWLTSEEGVRIRAVFNGMAKMMSELENDIYDNYDQTFINQSTGDYLDLHGRDRDKTRLNGESLLSFRTRVREVVNSANCPAIKKFVDALIIRGDSTVEDADDLRSFLNGGSFLDNNFLLGSSESVNTFIILVDKQIPEARTFLNGEFFLDNGIPLGAITSDIELFQNIISIVDEIKAFGVNYQIVEAA